MLQLRIHLANFLGVSERSGRVLGAEAAQKLYRHGYTFCKRYVALSNEALRPDMGVFFLVTEGMINTERYNVRTC